MTARFAILGWLTVFSAKAVLAATVTVGDVKGPVSPDLWGIFFEDIDLSLDGGVYAELVRNRSFEDFGGSDTELTLEYWDPVGSAEYRLDKSHPISEKNRHAALVRGKAGAGIANQGYFGMGIRKGMTYDLSVRLRSKVGTKVEVALERYNRPPLARGEIAVAGGDDWREYALELVADDDDPQARLVLRMQQAGELLVDCVSLVPRDAVAGLFRRDLVEKLAALKPSFVRFPGGCWVEGDRMKDAYRWKTTIGDKWERRTQWNCWKYWSTNGVGFHEYLLLAEALGAKPLFCINVGMSHKETVPMEKMGEFVQDALDCIEYANGPTNSTWGAKRAAAGHPAPFNLAYLEIGNENGGKAYEERYRLMAKAVRAKYPEVKLVFDNWKETKRVDDPKDLRDDHFYTTPDRMMGPLAHEYDEPKGDFGIFVGEYAVIRDGGRRPRYGTLRGAIGEAAFMCGLERNQDQVKLAAYAPLFANAQHTVWSPNLIYPTTDGCFVNPSWNVQRLFGSYRGRDVLATTVDSETFTTFTEEPWQRGTFTNVIAKVQASAVREADGTTVLKVVNAAEEPQEVDVRFASPQPVGTVRRIVFTGPDRDAHNSPCEPEALKERTSVLENWNGTDVLPPLSLNVYLIGG